MSGDRYGILVHGGTVRDPAQVGEEHTDLIERIIREAGGLLAGGGPALDAVIQAITAMEDSGILDAGRGSYLNSAGYVENDASLVEGHTGRTGAVAVMQRLKNPIQAARIAMERTPHVYFAGPAGEAVLAGLGAELVDDPAAYFTPSDRVPGRPVSPGTVGAVALDRHGRLAAGTSTGGTRGKLPGRVSDSSVFGAGTYADVRYALSATGTGEFFIRRAACRDIAMRAEYLGWPLQRAADHVVRELIGKQDKASGAVIAISRDGEIVVSANVYGVLHGFLSDREEARVGVAVNGSQ